MVNINRRPFCVTKAEVLVNGEPCLDIVVSHGLRSDQCEEAQQIMNDRFERYLDKSASTYGEINKTKYDLLVELFVETVIKPCCSVLSGQPA